MKVGVIGTIWLNIPPKGYGGTEDVVYNLVNGLVEKGHEVTLFGPQTAMVKAKVIGTVEKPLRDQDVPWTDVTHTLYHITKAFDMADEFDVLHMHLNKSQDYLALPLAMSLKTPVLFTPHFQMPTPTNYPDRYKILAKYGKLPFTSISNSQRDSIPLRFIKTIYNSLDIAKYPFEATPDDYFVWLGKVNPVKGTKEAILAAKKAGVKLIVMGVVDHGVAHMLSYYENEVKPLIDGQSIVWRGEVDIMEKARILGKAKAFLNPIQWEEPFGLVMAEAQAVGTPVISFRRGAAPEVIADGKTGYLVDTLDEMVDKINRIGAIERLACRTHIEQRFTIDVMVKDYLKVYESTIVNWEAYKKEQYSVIHKI